jgi:bifunctional non-homologous end joining protein LigD
MSLANYHKKRHFDKTPEPKGKQKQTGHKKLEFVIQKHKASHLHYDFRLECDGVLKSWAVPKGLSLNPAVKRLAMMVEDHPYDYKDFEGIIPKGNYGAGTVIVWDHGTYEPVGMEGEEINDLEKHIRGKLHKGEMKFRLHGEKLKGDFVIVRGNNAEQENVWFVYKAKDEYVSKKDITKEDKSVISGKTIEEVAATSTNEWQSNRKTKTTTQPTQDNVEKQIKEGKKAAILKSPSPMLATLDNQPFDSPDWLFEIKWDGYRAIASLNKGKVELVSRNNISLKKYTPIADALQELKMNAVLDGEIVVLDEKGHASFQMLQQWTKEQKGFICYQVFDLLWYDGYDLTGLPLIERKKILQNILPKNEYIRYCDHVLERGKEMYALSEQLGIEGVIAKKINSTYTAGVRSKNWLKLKNVHVLEAVIAGFTKGRNSRKYFGALILGEYEHNKLKYIGHTGSGMDEKTVKEVYQKLEPLITDDCPFEKKPKTNMPATWVQPKLVCTVKYQERTKDGILRIPIFQALREDKKVTDIKREAAYVEEIKEEKKPAKKAAAKKKGLLLPETEKEVTATINARELTFTNLDKLYWKDEKITKRDMLNYYDRMMPFILPYMRDRPQSLNRYPNGINGKSFYQKNVRGKVADWLATYEYTSESDGEEKDFLVCTDEASLLYIANLGCIEMNPWHSRTESAENPDWCVIDLDPDDIGFDKVIETANVVKKVLDAAKVESYCKTSGSTGLHIYIPLGARYTYDQSRMFAEIIVNIVHKEIPKFTSLERSPSKRRGLIYLDYLQNRNIQTIAAPYSLRPKPGASASAPLHWTEVKKGLTIQQFNIHTLPERVKKEGDLFKGVLGKGIDLDKALEHLMAM